MPTEHIPFFAAEANLTVLQGLLTRLPESSEIGRENPDSRLYLRQIVNNIVNDVHSFDELCPWSIERHGSSFISEARNYDPQHNSEELFALAYYFLCELEFAKQDNLNRDLRQIKSFIDDNLLLFPVHIRRNLTFANYMLPAIIVKSMVNHPNMVAMREYNERYESATTLKKQWDDQIEQKKGQVQEFQKQLDNQQSNFNFVGLVDGFRQLSKQKRVEKRIAFISLICLDVLLLSPVLVELTFINNHIGILDGYKNELLFSLPPLITIEVLLIYFFRVVLVHFQSIKTQLLQLELRKSLCQFIESYSSFSTDIKARDPSALEKFENLVFSGLISSEENLPSTFDGIEQLAKLFKGIKS